MRVVVAPDSFGSTLSAVQAARSITVGWRRTAPGDELPEMPLSDGGPGFVDTLAAGLGGQRRSQVVAGSLGHPVRADFLLCGSTAYLEAAQACGLAAVPPARRRPLEASTYGVGTLVREAVEAGAREIVVGLGGTATTDAGSGLLTALGLALLDAAGGPLPLGGGALIELVTVAGEAYLRGARLVAATDVDNPLVGPYGAAAVFGPQKGADPAAVAWLDAGLRRWAEVVERDVPGAPAGLAGLPGGGAAGGLGAALFALGATRRSGFELVADAVDLGGMLADADLVLTGEGRFDRQSLRGKVPSGVAARAAEHGVPCLVLAGQVEVGRREQGAAGIEAAYSMAEHAGSVDAALADPAGVLASLAARVAREWGG